MTRRIKVPRTAAALFAQYKALDLAAKYQVGHRLHVYRWLAACSPEEHDRLLLKAQETAKKPAHHHFEGITA